MSDLESALARMAASTEFGLLTTKRLRGLGLDAKSIGRLSADGRLGRAAHGVYSVGPASWIDRLRAVTRVQLAGKVVVSHRAAARLHGLWTGDELDLTIRYPGRARAAGFEIHRSRDLVSGVVTAVDGLPTTTTARTLCDLGLVLPPWEVRPMVEHAVATGMTTRSQLESVRWGVGEHGRNGVGAVDAALRELPASAEQTESGAEVRFLSLLSRTALPQPVPQLEVVACGHRYRLDFAYPNHRVAIEYDGAAYHATAEQRRRDAVRQRHLESAGWRVLRFDRTDLYSPADGGIVRRISLALHGAEQNKLRDPEQNDL